ncbi:MAG: hypothetical protein IJB86_07585 [Clostridia bacterium]|nr:hypothetical protein [Clostridia bacterium]
MLLKRLTAFLMCIITVSATVYSVFTYRFFDKPLSEAQKEAFCKEISLPDGFLLTASADSFDAVRNSDESVLSNFKSGSYAIELNVAFTDDSVPVLADGYEYVTDKAVTLESVFSLLKNKTYLRYIINITEQADYSVFNRIVEEYSLTERIIISGFTVDELDLMMTGLYSYSACVDINVDGDLSDPEYCRTLVDEISNYTPFAMRLSVEDVTKEFADAVTENHIVSLFIDNVDSSYDMFYALSLNPGGIISKDPHKLYSILVEQDLLDYKR